MKNNRHTLTGSMLTLFAAASALLLSACGQKSSKEPTTEPAAAKSLETIQILHSKPSDALAVKAAREQLQPGDQAVVFGQIGGAKEPFLQGYAGFVLADTEVVFCNESGDDLCPTPWDACCEDPEKLKASRASVQFVDAGGNLVESGLRGFAELEPLREIVVTGKVADSATPGNLIIHAQGLYLE